MSEDLKSPPANSVDFKSDEINERKASRPETASSRKSTINAQSDTNVSSGEASVAGTRPQSSKTASKTSLVRSKSGTASRPKSGASNRPKSENGGGPASRPGTSSKKSKSRSTSAASSKTSKNSKSSKGSKVAKAVATKLVQKVVPNHHPIGTQNTKTQSKVSRLSKNESQLIQACRRGNIDAVYEQLKKGTSTNCKVPIVGTTPLSIACQKGSKSLAAVLLEFGAKIRGVKDEYKVTPVHWAANCKESHLLQLLYKKGNLTTHDLLQQDEYGSTPLHFAAVRNSTEAVNFILAHGGNPLLTNNNDKKPSQVTSDEQIRLKLIAKENAILEKRFEDKGRQPRRSQDHLAPTTQTKKSTGRTLPSTILQRSGTIQGSVKSKTSAQDSKSSSGDPVKSPGGESNSSLSKQAKLKTFVSSTAR